MCGICGTIGIEKGLAVRVMAEGLLHRGPDGSGVWHGEGAALAHTRLAIIDTSEKGHQPMRSEDGGLCITYNGEIYNFPELKKELEEKGYKFISHTDTEVVLYLYSEYKEKCLDKMRGMFSFAIWDSKRKRLFAARDRLGVKPFFYYFKEKVFIFSSELKAMLSSGLVPKKINSKALPGYFTYGSMQSPDSMIEGVCQLEPAHYLYFENGRLDIKRYWSVPAAGSVKMDENEHAQEIRNILDEAVRIRMVGDVPVSVFLSGGLDSSTIASFAQKSSSYPVKTFSVVFGEPEYDESIFSDIASKAFGTDHSRIQLDKQSIVKEIPGIFEIMDEPSADGFNTFLVSKAVKEAGIKVALSGVGADELFGGYRFFKQLPAAAAILKIAGHIPPPWRRSLFAGTGAWGKTRFSEKLAFLLSEGKDLRDIYRCQRSVFLPQEIKDLLDIGGIPAFHSPALGPDGKDLVNLLSFFELNGYLQNTLLHDTDRMSMANSIEVRTPFLDHLLVEKIFQIPGRMKVLRGRPKRLLAKSVEGMIPREILDRPKKGFVLPFEYWLRHELKDLCEDMLSPESLKNIPVLKYAGVRKTWDKFLRRPRSCNYSSILTLVSFVSWHRKNIQ